MPCLGVPWLDNLLDQLWSDKLCKGLVVHCQLLPFNFGKISWIKFDQLSILLPVTKSGRIQCCASGSQFGPPGLPPLVSHCGLSLSKMQLFPLKQFRPIFLERNPYFMGLIGTMITDWGWVYYIHLYVKDTISFFIVFRKCPYLVMQRVKNWSLFLHMILERKKAQISGGWQGGISLNLPSPLITAHASAANHFIIIAINFHIFI